MKQFLTSVLLVILSASAATAAFDKTNDIYCKPVRAGTCTLSLHMGAHLDWLTAYFNNLGDGTHKPIPGLTHNTHHRLRARHNRTWHRHRPDLPATGYNSSQTNSTGLVVPGIPINGTNGTIVVDVVNKDEIDVTVAYGDSTQTLEIMTGPDAAHKRGMIPRETPPSRPYNASNWLGDVAIILDHNCDPVSKVTNGLNDTAVIRSKAAGDVHFMLWEPGSGTNHHDFNFVFASDEVLYEDFIGMDQGLEEGDNHPCTCMPTDQMCPDGSAKCCSCRFDCNTIKTDA